VTLAADALPGQSFTGTVDRIAPVVDSGSGTFRVVSAFDGAAHALQPGMFGRIRIDYDQRADALVVPRLALLDDGEPAVFRVRGQGVPVVTAAVYFGPAATLVWTALVSAAYCSYLLPVLQDYVFTEGGIAELVIRNLFFFLAAIIVNRFAVENRRQTLRYQLLAEELSETNRLLERAQAQARRSERLAALGQLSAGLAHEIRNPLGIIKGSAEMLNQRLKAAEPLAAELAGYISSEVNRLSDLVARFLDFARPLRLELQPASLPALPALADRALHSVAAAWSGAPIQVLRRYEDNLPNVPLDEKFCEQVFVNLVQNAYEAMSEHGGELQVSLNRAERGGRPGIEASIADTGPGVPAELREQIFNPFFTTKQSGVGLGLSIVSKIVDEHRGTIELAPTTTGARFILFFPLTGDTESLRAERTPEKGVPPDTPARRGGPISRLARPEHS